MCISVCKCVGSGGGGITYIVTSAVGNSTMKKS